MKPLILLVTAAACASVCLADDSTKPKPNPAPSAEAKQPAPKVVTPGAQQELPSKPTSTVTAPRADAPAGTTATPAYKPSAPINKELDETDIRRRQREAEQDAVAKERSIFTEREFRDGPLHGAGLPASKTASKPNKTDDSDDPIDPDNPGGPQAGGKKPGGSQADEPPNRP